MKSWADLLSMLGLAPAPAPVAPPRRSVPVARSTKPGVAKPAPAKAPGAAQAPAPVRKPQDAATMGSRENPIMLRDNIPAYERVLSGDASAAFPLSDEFKHEIAVLLTSEDKKTVEIIISTRLKQAQVIADTRERVKRAGYKMTSPLYADSGILGLIGEATTKAGATTNAKDLSDMQRLFDELLVKAVKMNASDIHIEARRNDAMVRFRADGDLIKIHDWSPQQAEQLASVIYNVIAEEKDVTFQKDRTQDAVAERDVRVGEEIIRVRARIATMPAYPAGFDMVMRILRMGHQSSSKAGGMAGLGYLPEQILNLELAISRPVGVTIMSGVTGSGKSTSLTTMVGKRITDYHGRIKVITVEDPPEIIVPGATQSPVVRSKAGKGDAGEKVNPFAASIKAAMRSDPDVIMVGEVRDEESAKLLVSATQSGHQVFTTVHAPSAFGIIGRLRSLGVPNDVLGSLDFVSGLVYQTLCPVLCPKCSIPLDEFMANDDSPRNQRMKMRLARAVDDLDDTDIRFRNPAPVCGHCNNKGIVGRTVVAEVVLPDEHMKILFSEGKDTEAIRYWKAEKDGKTVLWYGIGKMKEGMLDPFDVEHKMGMLDSDVPRVIEATKFGRSRRPVSEQEMAVLVFGEGALKLPAAPAKSLAAPVAEPLAQEQAQSLTNLDGDALADLTSFGGQRPSAVVEPFLRQPKGAAFNEFDTGDDSIPR